ATRRGGCGARPAPEGTGSSPIGPISPAGWSPPHEADHPGRAGGREPRRLVRGGRRLDGQHRAGDLQRRHLRGCRRVRPVRGGASVDRSGGQPDRRVDPPRGDPIWPPHRAAPRPMKTLTRAVLAAANLGGWFGEAGASTVSTEPETFIVDIYVDVAVSAQSVVAHLSTGQEDSRIVSLIHRGGTRYGIRTELP